MSDPQIKTEDNVLVSTGDRVYNYYDMKPGVIVPGTCHVYEGERARDAKRDIWFTFRADSGGTAILNGERICTIAFAQRRGFRGV